MWHSRCGILVGHIARRSEHVAGQFHRAGLNVDHVATVRQARRARHPDPVHAALLAEQAGADSITMHLREDRRHIIDRDPFALQELMQTHLNLEMAVTPEMLAIALRLKPADCCLVPEKRTEVTTEGGLDVVAQQPLLQDAVAQLRSGGIRVSLFIDPELAQVDAARAAGAQVVELHTGSYAESTGLHEGKNWNACVPRRAGLRRSV